MKIYYLQKDATGRRFIDDKLHEGCTQLDVKEAESWKAARALFSLRS
ncbi:hypothetical protein [Paraherbaspirillum soli]|uniref:Uncharacterized protein n=1 Tax=Paraherbaspirillum soli TaxID=631222 RepID=A0ABW0MAK8_9BURK